jgi:hypothetical protein
MEAEVGVISPEAKEYVQIPEENTSKEGFSPIAIGGCAASRTREQIFVLLAT